MAQATAKKDQNQTELLFEPKRDINPYWSSSLFSDVYLKNDFPREYSHLWKNDENSGFTKFYQGFIDLCVDLNGHSFKNWRENETVDNWIIHIMRLLGWENNSKGSQNSRINNHTFTVKENGKRQIYRPDLIYFDRPEFKIFTQEQREINGKLREIRHRDHGAKVVLEAKYWDRLSLNGEKIKKNQDQGDSASSLGPELQTLKYMDLLQLDYGILTDGKTWKLLHREFSQGIPNRCFEFDLGPLIELAIKLSYENNEIKFNEYAKYFYYFFSKESFCETKLLDQVLEYSKRYARRIEEDLKDRFIVSMGVICNSIKRTADHLKLSYDLDLIRNVAESHLFTILFIKSCEVRNILPIKSPNYIKISLHEVIESLSKMEFDPERNLDRYLVGFQAGNTFGGKKFDWNGFQIFDRFINLYEIIHDGTNSNKDFGFEIEGFKESIFSKEEWGFAKKIKICNRDMVTILFNLNFTNSDFPQIRKYQQIPYSYFSPRQLGSIYESFLEFKLRIAKADLVLDKQEWKEGNHNSRKVIQMNLSKEFIVKKGDLYFDTDNIDRKITGSYYTPDHIVSFIIEKSIAPLLLNIKSSKELLKLKICDPAMGSGHFLSGALDYLTKNYRKMISDETLDDIEESFAQSARVVLDSCIFGVDLNPRAVKLAKMSLWLSTAEPARKLERLDDQLKIGNSLTAFEWRKEFKNIIDHGGFDALILNPPYIFTRDNKFDSNQKDEFKNEFIWSRFKANTYQFFIEKSYQLVKEDGSVGAIIPNNWMTVDSSDIFRKSLIENSSSMILVNSLDKIFQDAAVDTSICIFRKATGSRKCHLSMNKLENGSISHLYESELLPSNAIISSKKTDKNFELIELNSLPLSHFYDVKAGMQCYEVGKGSPTQTEDMKNNRIYHHRSRINNKCRKYLLGKDVCRYYLNWSGDYVEYGKNLSAPRDPSLFSSHRVLIRQIPSKPPLCINSTYTNGEEVNDINSMVVPCKNDFDAFFLMALLNTRIVSDWFITKFDKFQRKTFPQIKVKELSLFPYPKNISDKDKCQVVDLSKKIYEKLMKDDKADIRDFEFKIEEIIGRSFGLVLKAIKKSA